MSRLKDKLTSVLLHQLPEFLRGDESATILTLNANVTSTSNSIVLVTASDLVKAGDEIISALVPSNTYVKEVKSTTRVIASKNATSSGTNSVVTFKRTNDVPRFYKFLEAYYSFIQQDQGAQEVIQNAKLYFDVDQTTASLLESFFINYGKDLPRNIVADKRSFVKFFRDVYKTKGSEQAYELLFRVMFGEKVDFFYPESVVLRASDGIWKTDKYIRVKTFDTSSPFDFKDTKVTGNTSGASAIVSDVIKYFMNETEIYELLLDEDSITGEFIVYEQLKTNKRLNANSYSNVYANILPLISNVNIINPGLGYTTNSIITVTATTGSDAQLKVESVDSFGRIKQVRVLDFGINYSNANITISNPSKTLTGNLILISNSGTVTFTDKHGLVSGNQANLFFTGNTLSALNNTFYQATVNYVPNDKSIRFNVTNANTRSAVTLNYTNTANLQANIGVIGTTLGYWETQKGILNTRYLRGTAEFARAAAPYYQPFSYVLKSNLDTKSWLDIAKKTVHPAGMAVFGEVQIDDKINLNTRANVIEEIWDYFSLTADNYDPNLLTSNTTYTANSIVVSLLVSNVYHRFRYL